MKFWRRQRESEPQTVALAEQEEPIETEPAVERPIGEPLTAEPLEQEYVEVATALGMADCPAVFNAQLRQFLAEEGITCYPHERVGEYMHEVTRVASQKAGRKISWEWRPVRHQDATPFASGGWISHMGKHDVPISVRPYEDAIPLPVLLTIKKIADRFGSRACFFVSDYKDSKPDPFLMVTGEGIPDYIIERWDEPSFRS